MGFLKGRRSIAEMEEEKEYLTVEEECLTKKAEIAEREAVISELRKKYGTGWAKVLGVSKLTDLSTLRSFLRGAKAGLDRQGGSPSKTAVSKMMDFGGMTKA